MKDEILDEVCVSYDLKSRAISFYNTLTQNRIRYSSKNLYNIIKAVSYIMSLKPIIHWPLHGHVLRTFIKDVQAIEEHFPYNIVDQESILKSTWERFWREMERLHE